MSLLRLILTTATLAVYSGSAFAQAASTGTVSKAELPALIKEAIMNNPEMIMQALEKLRMQKAEAAKKEAAELLSKNKGDVFNNPNIPAAGASAKDADVTVVEFFDYHCGYCKHFLPVLNKLIAQDKKVRILFMDFPILSEDSALAAKAALAVNKINKSKYFEYHQALMNEKGAYKEERLVEIAKGMGIKADDLKKAMDSAEVAKQLKDTRELAGKLNITGTPAIIVGDIIIPGAMQYEELKLEINKQREAASEK
jgi:protein-disulfide isomerase